MKIAVWWNLHPGGARRALHDHLRGLAERGHEVHVVRPPVPEPEWMSPEGFAASVQVVPLPSFVPSGGGYVANVVAEVRRLRSLVPDMESHCAEAGTVIQALRPDVLFASTCWLMATPSIVRHVGDLPRVVYLQEPKRSLYEANPILPWIEVAESVSMPARIRRRISLKALARQARFERSNAVAAGEILVNSLYSRESVRRVYGLDSTFCPLGVDTERFAPDVAERERFVLGVGAVVPTKGVRVAIDACLGAGLPLTWVGPFEDSVYGPEMRAYAEQRGTDVTWQIGVSDEALVDLYRRCLTVIACAPLEPFGYTPVEAGACGAAVVAIAEGGFRETVSHGENGLLALDRDELADALRSIADDPALARRLRETGRRFAESEWSLERGTDGVERALQRAIKAQAK